MMKQNFRDDLEEVLRIIHNAESFALSRFADGEACVLKNETVGNKDGWLYKKDKNLIFRRDLRKSLLCTDASFFYGISCSCCDRKNHDFLLGEIHTPLENLTFSNIWVNSNYPVFNEHFLPTIRNSRKKVILVSGSKARVDDLNRQIPISDFIPIPKNCVVYWEKNRDWIRGLLDLKASMNRGAIFLFAAGPLSEILIFEMWKANHNNAYIDIGSTLDPILFRRKSRGYHTEGHMFAGRTCVW